MSAQPAYTYDAWLRPTQHEPTGIVDGDTVYCGIDLGLNVAVNTTIRLYGINAPEMSTAAGRIAKAWALDWFAQHCPTDKFVLHTELDHTEKYGRYLGVITALDGHVFNDDIVAAGNAVPYFP